MDRIRLVVAVLVGLSLLYLGFAAATAGGDASNAREGTDVEPLTGPTVIATQKGELVAYERDGTRTFYTDRHDSYYDVDPLSHQNRTVVLVAADAISCKYPQCFRIVIERLNLTTGDRQVIYETTSVGEQSVIWHDVDRLSEGRYLVANIKDDRIFELDTSGPVERWGWSASMAFDHTTGKRPLSTGGRTWTDWTHLNDVEQINDTTVMASLRNHDTVVFVHEDRGLLEGLTLGSDDNHRILNEQHNPDYIPEEQGGPAVLVADSTNDRIVEYQRHEGAWERSWTYTNPGMAWPRDADRLPNGNTLITDSNANRVIEIDQEGEIQFSIGIASPYDAERLGTGDESAGGPAAARAELRSMTGSEEPPTPSERIKGLFPTIVVHALMFITPVWVGVLEFGVFLFVVVTLVAWIAFELYRSPYTYRWPVARRSDP